MTLRCHNSSPAPAVCSPAGTAPEQAPPADQLSALQQSIAAMEGQRAQDVAFQKASKELAM